MLLVTTTGRRTGPGVACCAARFRIHLATFPIAIAVVSWTASVYVSSREHVLLVKTPKYLAPTRRGCHAAALCSWR